MTIHEFADYERLIGLLLKYIYAPKWKYVLGLNISVSLFYLFEVTAAK